MQNILPNIAALRALSLVPSSSIYVEGYTALADGGEGVFTYVSADTTSSDNGGTIIVDTTGHRWHRQTGQYALSILWFGGSNHGSIDNLPAWNRLTAVIASQLDGAVVYFPCGTYYFSGPATFTWPSNAFSLTIKGDGADATVLRWQTGNGLELSGHLSGHTVHLADFSVVTSATNAGTGITLTSSGDAGVGGQNDLTRITVRGADGLGFANCWATGIANIGWCLFNYYGCLFYGGQAGGSFVGVGLDIAGNSAGNFKYSLCHNINSCGFFTLGIGYVYGAYLQGVTINGGTNFTNIVTDIYVPATAVGGTQLVVTGCQLSATGNCIYIGGAIASVMIMANQFYISGSGTCFAAIDYIPGSIVTGNSFDSATAGAAIAIDIGGANSGTLITANSMANFAVGIGAALNADCNIQSNKYTNCTIKVNAASGNTVGGGSP